MDIALNLWDEYLFTPYVYPKSWAEDDWWRQLLSLDIVLLVSVAGLYLMTSSLNYVFLYDKRLLKHPHMLENQMRKEITCALLAMPVTVFLSAPIFLLEVRGHSKLYDTIDEANFGWFSIIGSCLLLIAWIEFFEYWLHYAMHHRSIYKYIHKVHHKFIIPTPFASLAFHPVDNYIQSLPFHLYIFLFPMHRVAFIVVLFLPTLWAVSVHDGCFKVPEFLKGIVHGSAHHIDHHTKYNYNFGQYFTLWDRIGGTLRNPTSHDEGLGPGDEVVEAEKEGKKNA